MKFAEPIGTLHYGLGPIGCEVVRVVASKQGMRPVAAVDIDPAKAGKDLGEVAGLGRELGVQVSGDLASALSSVRSDIAVHSTGSSLVQVMPQLESILAARLPIVSTCEELAFPIAERVEPAGRLDQLARDQGVAVLSTGINPGFSMDIMAIAFSGVCQDIRSIRVTRVLDAGGRRLPFQQKVGVGLEREAFQKLVDAGKVRHVGLLESVNMIAAAVGWELDETRESTEAVVATRDLETEYFQVKPGQIAGVHQVGLGLAGGRELIRLDVSMYVGAENSDSVRIEGVPPIDMVVRSGLHGDRCTAAIVANSIPRVLSHAPGLATMKDIPHVAATLGDVRRQVTSRQQ